MAAHWSGTPYTLGQRNPVFAKTFLAGSGATSFLIVQDALFGLSVTTGSGQASAGLTAVAVAVKSLANAGRASAGVSTRAASSKVALFGALASYGATSRATGAKAATTSARASAGVSARAVGTQAAAITGAGQASAGVSTAAASTHASTTSARAASGVSASATSKRATSAQGLAAAGATTAAAGVKSGLTTGLASAGASALAVGSAAPTVVRAGHASAGASAVASGIPGPANPVVDDGDGGKSRYGHGGSLFRRKFVQPFATDEERKAAKQKLPRIPAAERDAISRAARTLASMPSFTETTVDAVMAQALPPGTEPIELHVHWLLYLLRVQAYRQAQEQDDEDIILLMA